jgi:menaquinone-dependent protoporphyrinogen oxidase
MREDRRRDLRLRASELLRRVSGLQAHSITMRVLVAFGSRYGGTAGIATIIGDELQRAGHDVVVRPADQIGRIDAFQAVIVGGALYANRWHRDARRFVARHAEALRRVPVWLFSSGPLDDSASHDTIQPPSQVRALMHRIGARDHVTFGGRLAPDVKGFPASVMAKTLAGDWRDPTRIRAWAVEIATMLPTARPGVVIADPGRTIPRLLAHAAVGWAATAIVTGILLATWDVRAAIVFRSVAMPAVYSGIALHYFKREGAREPLPAAFSLIGIAVALDVAIFAGVIEPRVLFGGVIAPLLPFALAFVATWAIGWLRSTMPWPTKHAATRGAS